MCLKEIYNLYSIEKPSYVVQLSILSLELWSVLNAEIEMGLFI